ncbi:predicted protein [Botrytis cinerea T4]|uniref:Uncharacterized protein n=1 Tax=Botryotinia fuckeliana (strain T4) TaxID=999810 RepID=G2YJ51_BOTF4|nr:predicted protein [Botrytis cinerea T4]
MPLLRNQEQLQRAPLDLNHARSIVYLGNIDISNSFRAAEAQAIWKLGHGLSVRTSSAACTSRNATTCSIRKCFFVPPIPIADGQKAIAFSLN